MRRWALVVLCGCGRVQFDPLAADAPGEPATASVAERIPCGTQVLLDAGGHNAHDVIRWVHEDGADWLIGANHYAQDDHKIERHLILDAANGASAGAAEFMVQADHVDVLAFEEVPGGHVMGYTDFALNTGHTVVLGPGAAVGAQHDLGLLASGNPPLARSGNGKLAMIGLINGNLQVLGVFDDGAPTGVSINLATAADGAGLPTMITLPDGLAVVWHSSASGTCKLATLAADLSLVNGPVDLAVAGCSDAHVAYLPAAHRLIVVADDPANGAIVGATWDESLAPVVLPRQLATGAHWVRIIADNDAAWIAWAEAGSPQKVRSALLDADANIVMMGAPLGALDETLGHFHTMDRVLTATVVMWTDTLAGRTFSAERLCR
jgi:hypothetical protein